MKRIGEILVDNHLITPQQLAQALEFQTSQAIKKKIGEILIDMNFLTYDVLLGYLDAQLMA